MINKVLIELIVCDLDVELRISSKVEITIEGSVRPSGRT
jgi:hypothetical protein